MRLPGIEAARGLAAVLVVTLHVTAILAVPSTYARMAFGGFFTFGRAGVDFFFVLSGFIIAYVHARDIGRPDRLPVYASRRLWRIYPLYILVSLALQSLLMASPSRSGVELDAAHVVMSWLLIPEVIAPILEVGWSLRNELLFYGMFGLLLLHRGLGRAALALWATGIVFNGIHRMVGGTWFFTGGWHVVVFRFYNIEFFFGLAVAGLVQRVAWRPQLVSCAGALLFFATGMSEAFGRAHLAEWPPRHLAYGLGAAMAIYGLASMDQAARSRVPRWMVAIGGASYSIYLVHVPVSLVLGYAVRVALPYVPLPIGMAFAALVAGSIWAGLLLSRTVEQPLLRWSRGALPVRVRS